MRVGGLWRTEGSRADGKPFAVWGEYTRVDPPNALGFTWNHDWGERALPATHVLVELTATSSGTHVAVTHVDSSTPPRATTTTRDGSVCWAGSALICGRADQAATPLITYERKT